MIDKEMGEKAEHQSWPERSMDVVVCIPKQTVVLSPLVF